MAYIFTLILIACILLFFIGVISPKTALFWYKGERTRKFAAVFYFFVSVVSLVGIGITASDTDTIAATSPDSETISTDELKDEDDQLSNLQIKESLEREIEGIKTFDNSKYRGSVDKLQLELIIFGAWAHTINMAEGRNDPELTALATKLRKAVTALQKKEYPLMRADYSQIVGKTVWEHNIYTKVGGKGNGYIEFTGSAFADNGNIKAAYEAAGDMFKLLRFSQARYKWSKYDSEYQYFTIDSPKDGDLMVFDN